MKQHEKTEHQQLRNRWLARTGQPMPYEISVMPLSDIRRKLELVETMNTVGVIPRQSEPRLIPVDESSLEEWDSQDAGRLNLDIGR